MYGYHTERENSESFPYTDLALERRRADTSLTGVEYKKELGIYGVWERIKISSEEGARSIGKPMGIYDTLETSRMDLLDNETIADASDEVARELCYLTDVFDAIPEKILIVGLGNERLTPDSLGARSAKKVKATMHIKEQDEKFFYALECSQIAVCTPDVASNTGLDSLTVIKAISEQIEPDLVIVIDALCSRSEDRLGSTVQFSTTGILPGSGLGNGRGEISQRTLGCPVIGIGVPTVIDSRMFTESEKNGEGTEKGKNKKAAMYVSPKEIDEIIEVSAKIIAEGINQAFGMPI